MRKWFKWPRVIWSIAAVLLLWDLSQGLIFRTPSFERCTEQYYANNADQSSRGNESVARVAVGYRDCIGQFLNENTGAITGLGTLFVALFTLTLYLVTNKAVNLARKEFSTAQRAFVFIDGFNYELTTADDARDRQRVIELLPEGTRPELHVTRFAVQPRWKNGGETPTRNMRIHVRTHGPDIPMGDAQYTYADRPDPFFLGPKATEIGEMIEVQGLNALIQNGAPGLNGPVPFLFIYGRAEYDDIFGGHHIFQWCYRMRPEAHRGQRPTVQFIQWGDYNQAYEGAASDRWPPAPRPWWEATAEMFGRL